MNVDFRAQMVHIFGDSHVNSLSVAAIQMHETLRKDGFLLGTVRTIAAANDFYLPFHEVTKSGLRLTVPAMAARLAGSLCNSDGLLQGPDGSLWLISGGFHTLVFLNSKRWESHRHWRIGTNPALQPVSSGAFAEMVLDLNRPFLRFLADSKALGHHVAVLSSPPITTRFLDRLASKGWSPEDIQFLDAEARAVIAAELERMAIALIGPPEDSTQGGFLHKAFVADDPNDTHHGNIAYSCRVLTKIKQTCGGARS